MIPNEALGAWLADRSAQAATMERVDEFARAYRNIPALVELERELASTPANRSRPILELARRFLHDPSAIEACMGSLLGVARADPFFRPPLRNSSTEILSGLWLYDGPLLSIFLALVTAEGLAAKRSSRSGAASIAFTGQRSLYRFLRSGGAVVSIWEAPYIESGFSSESSGRCRLVERRSIEDGETIEVDGRRQGFVVDHAFSDIVYVQAITPVGAAPLMTEYDSDTLRFVGASSTDEASSRIQMMLSLLRIMDRADAAPVFEEMLASPHFYARWQTMREFLALDAERALPHLVRLAFDDPHPEVRTAASRTLQIITADVAAAEEEVTCPA
jgi:hypothetical protein